MHRVAFAIVLLLLIISIPVVARLGGRGEVPSQLEQLRLKMAQDKHVPSVDHTKFDVLKEPFDSPEKVTEACLSCHTERGKEVMQSSHWRWDRVEYIPGHGIRALGKRNVLNNFCIGTQTNLASCDKCHTGFGFVDQNFDFNAPTRIDCLACHDTPGPSPRPSYGRPADSVDLNEVATHVGRPTRDNCGTCHFFGGGGNNTKHGDLEKAMFDPPREVDVHLAADGANIECVDCHKAKNHQLLGKVYSIASMDTQRSTCTQCHGETPHDRNRVLNEHTLKVACQTCHIPRYAKVNKTNTYWDWSEAGKFRDGKPYVEVDEQDNHLYMSIKGSFVWESNLTPEYIFFNGTAGHYLLGDKVEGDGPVKLNTLYGSYDDPESKIIPVKVHRAKQLFDPVTRMLIQPKLVGKEKGEGAYWKDFDWDRAARIGMEAVGLPYSGEYSFIETEMTWPINHMVSPADEAVTCVECHTRDGSRLAGLEGFYMPGRDRSETVERIGRLALLIALAGVLLHGGVRFVAHQIGKGAV